MLRMSEMREKEVINVFNGEKLGYIYDFEIDVEKGVFTGIVLIPQGRTLSFFGKANDLVIDWKKIIKIGTDIILVNNKIGE